MQSWSQLSDVKKLLLKQWQKGVFLQQNTEALFPLYIKLKKPNAKQLSEQYAQCQNWLKPFMTTTHYNIQWQDINHQKLGKIKLPIAVIFNSLAEVLNTLEKQDDYEQYKQLSTQLLHSLSALSIWVSDYPFKLLNMAGQLSQLIKVSEWLLQNPLPNIYIRQMTLTGLNTKLIEQNKAVLTQWWDILLAKQHINHECVGIKQFEKRFGFKAKPELLRIRLLDANLMVHGLTDITMTSMEFNQLQLDIDTVFVTENDINGLTFPDFPKAIVLFGRGYGFNSLKNAKWMMEKRIIYWGDIDTHGFAILSQFRHIFAHAKSLLMDKKTLMQHQSQWVEEYKPTAVDLNYLTDEELQLYNVLRDGTIQKNLRLEQEFISFLSLSQQLKRLSV